MTKAEHINVTQLGVSLVPIKAFLLNDMLQYIQELKEDASGNLLIVSTPTEQVQRATIHKKKSERREVSLFSDPSFLPFLPLSASHSPTAVQWVVTCFSFRGKNAPQAFHRLSFLPSLTNSTLYMHFISVRWIPGRKLLSHPEVKREKNPRTEDLVPIQLSERCRADRGRLLSVWWGVITSPNDKNKEK